MTGAKKKGVDPIVLALGGGVLLGALLLGWKFVLPRLEHSKGGNDAGEASGAAPEARMVPPEAYMRTYIELFGGLSPLDVQARARGPEGLFDTWDAYIASLGLPDYKIDSPRQTQTNALMVATFERLGIALCDRAVEADLKAKPAVPVDKRVVFTFDVPAGELDQAGFATRFDSLHRLMLGYPSALAPKDRLTRFYALYTDIVSEHAKGTPHSKFTPAESGWAAVCYGLVRHPEFHFY